MSFHIEDELTHSFFLTFLREIEQQQQHFGSEKTDRLRNRRIKNSKNYLTKFKSQIDHIFTHLLQNEIVFFCNKKKRFSNMLAAKTEPHSRIKKLNGLEM